MATSEGRSRPAIGIDVGGTKIAAGLVSGTGRLSEVRTEPTPTAPDRIAAVCATLARRLMTDHEVVGVGLGAAGFVGEDRSTVRFAPNIDWRDEPLGQTVERALGVPVVVENDANAAAWGEYCFGAGEDTDQMLLVTVGTGVGGGIVHHRQLLRGGFGVAAEIGHLRVVPGGRLCGCGQRGCLEQYGSGTALVRDARERIDARDAAAGPLLDAAAGGEISGPLVTEMAKQGDPMCRDVLHDTGRWLGEAIASLCAVLDPSVVAIGGGVADAGDLLLRPLGEAFDQATPARGYHPLAELRIARLGNDAGIIGAGDLARSPR